MLENQHPTPAARRWPLFALAAAAALALDRWTKQWAWDHLRPPGGGPVTVWPAVLELEFAYNRGSAFGVIPRLDSQWLLLAITAVLIVWVVGAARAPGAGRLRDVAAGLVVGGALGNLHDRWLRVDARGDHGVVDFIRVHLPWGASWPNFNVADAALVIGALLLAWTLRAAKPG
jgi:signal peptidase II